jgi:hypothetical protein
VGVVRCVASHLVVEFELFGNKVDRGSERAQVRIGLEHARTNYVRALADGPPDLDGFAGKFRGR